MLFVSLLASDHSKSQRPAVASLTEPQGIGRLRRSRIGTDLSLTSCNLSQIPGSHLNIRVSAYSLNRLGDGLVDQRLYLIPDICIFWRVDSLAFQDAALESDHPWNLGLKERKSSFDEGFTCLCTVLVGSRRDDGKQHSESVTAQALQLFNCRQKRVY